MVDISGHKEILDQISAQKKNRQNPLYFSEGVTREMCHAQMSEEATIHGDMMREFLMELLRGAYTDKELVSELKRREENNECE